MAPRTHASRGVDSNKTASSVGGAPGGTRCGTSEKRPRHVQSPAERREGISAADTPDPQTSIYQPIDTLHAPSTQQAFDLEDLLEKRVGELGRNVYQSKVADKVVVLEQAVTSMQNSAKQRRKQSTNSKSSAKGASRVRYRAESFAEQFVGAGAGGNTRNREHRLQQLSEMWTEYMTSRMRANRFDRKVVVSGPARTDWHGAQALVVAAANPTLVGLHGVIVRETKHSLVLAMCGEKKEKLCQIPKVGTRLHVMVKAAGAGAAVGGKCTVVDLHASCLL